MSNFASEMLNDMCDTYDMYDIFSKQIGLKYFLTKSLRRNAILFMKNSYLCSDEMKDGNDAQGSEIFVSGLQKFSPCPERKN